MQKKMRILWLTDIHYKPEYLNNTKVSDLINGLTGYLDKHGRDITHIVITGDLSFSGDSGDYPLFKAEVFDKVVLSLPNLSKSFVVPGNHDVEWNSVKKLWGTKGDTAFIERSNIQIKVRRQSQIFSGYRYEGNRLKEGVLLSERKTDTANDLSKINEEGFFGYYFDATFNALFILINSAWLSYGAVPNNEISKAIEADMPILGVKNTLKRLSETNKNDMVEMGNQTYGFHLFKDLGLLEEIKVIIAENDPFVISLAHHPPGWLDWYDTHSEDHRIPPPISYLTEVSNLHLTGHEHAAPFKGQILDGTCLHLSSGMLLDSAVEGDPDAENVPSPEDFFPSNWFSILEIDKGKVDHKFYKYNLDRRDSFQWEYKDCLEYQYYEDGSICFLGDPADRKALKDIPARPRVPKSGVCVAASEIKPTDLIQRFQKKSQTFRYDPSIDQMDRLGDGLHLTYFPKRNELRYFFLFSKLYLDEQKQKINPLPFKAILESMTVFPEDADIVISIVDTYTEYGGDNGYDNTLTFVNTTEYKSTREVLYNSYKHLFFNFLIGKEELFRRLAECRFTFDTFKF